MAHDHSRKHCHHHDSETVLNHHDHHPPHDDDDDDDDQDNDDQEEGRHLLPHERIAASCERLSTNCRSVIILSIIWMVVMLMATVIVKMMAMYGYIYVA